MSKYLIIYSTATFKLVDSHNWRDEHNALIVVKLENGRSTVIVNKAQETELEKMAVEAVRSWARGLKRIDPVRHSIEKVVERWEAAAKNEQMWSDPLPLGTSVNSTIDIASPYGVLIPAGSPGVVCSHKVIDGRPTAHVRFTFMEQLPRSAAGMAAYTQRRIPYRLQTSTVPVIPGSICIIDLPNHDGDKSE